MKIASFTMLIVDDNKEVSETIETDISTWLDSKGFELKTAFQTEKKGVLEEIKKNDIELIVIDYDLGERENGDKIIKEIRDKDYYHDIIFYTAGKMEDILTKSYNGVFYASKKDATDIIKEVIDLRLKKSSDLATLRGWIVADAIELEYMIEELLLKCFSPKHEVFETQIMRRPGVLDFNKKQMIINSMLSDELKKVADTKDESERAKKLQSCKEVFKSFETDVVHYRNAVAHSKLEITADGVKRLKTIGGSIKHFDFDEANLIEARKKFRKQRDCLLTLLEHF